MSVRCGFDEYKVTNFFLIADHFPKDFDIRAIKYVQNEVGWCEERFLGLSFCKKNGVMA
jgi:hypothetical protein